MTVMLAGAPAKLDDFEDLIRRSASSSSSGRAGWPCLSWTGRAARLHAVAGGSADPTITDREAG